MSVIKKDREMGMVVVNPDLSSRILGFVSTQLIVDSLRELPKHEELQSYPGDRVDSVIECLKVGWAEIDRYLHDGGVISNRGVLRFLSEFRDDTNIELSRRGFLHTRSGKFSSQSVYEDGYPYRQADGLSVAAPELGPRLKLIVAPQGRVRKAFSEYHLSLPQEPLKNSFVEHAVEGFGERMAIIFAERGIGKVVSPKKAAEMRWYDHARKEVPVLEEM